MNILYILPFSYFYNTRLRNGSWVFHALFEWLSAAILVMALGSVPPFQALIQAILVYFAFISLYEIGYLVNDLFAARKEKDGRRRGPHPTRAGGARFAVRLVDAALTRGVTIAEHHP